MRVSARRVVQVIFVTSCLATVNFLFVLLKNSDSNSDGRDAKKLLGQERRQKDGGPDPGLGHSDGTINIFAKSPKSGRRVSSLSRYQRDLEREIARGYGASRTMRQSGGKRPSAKDANRRKVRPSESVLRFQQQHSNSRATELNDIFISVKTTRKFHTDRLDLLSETWIALAKEQTYIFSDADDPVYRKQMKNHFINTNCSSEHSRRALCCKMAVEYDYFMDSNKRWFCHVDDDTYVNIPALVNLLQQYNHTEDWYLGKPSLAHPIELTESSNPQQKIAFWFATGGAGMCISRSLALKMMPFAGGGKLMSVGEKIRLPDDCTVGYIINYILKKELTVVNTFHSHLEGLWLVEAKDLHKHITFSYSKYGEHWNIVNMPHGFNSNVDPTRFRSIHCHLFSNFKKCPPSRLR